MNGIYQSQHFGYNPQNTNNVNGPVTLQQLDPNALVGTQITGLLADNNPYIEQARAQGAQQASSRGLLNSSMSAGSAQNAAIQAALPIAQGNAQEYAQVGAANQQAMNQYLGEATAASAQIGSANIAANASKHNAELAADVQRLQIGNQYKEFGQSQGQQFQEYGMGLGEQYAQLGQQNSQYYAGLNQQGHFQQEGMDLQRGEYEGSQSFQNYWNSMAMQQNSQQNYAQEIAAMQANPNMTADDRAAMFSNLQSIYQQQSSFNSNIPAYTPPWHNDPGFWTGG